MIPLHDEGAQQSREFPIVNIAIIVLNFLMFAVELIWADAVVNGWSLIPKEILTGQDIVGMVNIGGGESIQLYPAPFGNVYLTLITSMFMHGGWLHILSNMLFLFIFGDNVENNFGHVKYLIFYLICGLGADFAQVIMGGADSVVPNLGASGAIAGVLAGYLILFPLARVQALVPLGSFSTVTTVPAFILIGVWIVIQIVSVSLLGEQGGDVAYWAHIGGFFIGLALTFVFRSSEGAAAHLPSYYRR